MVAGAILLFLWWLLASVAVRDVSDAIALKRSTCVQCSRWGSCLLFCSKTYLVIFASGSDRVLRSALSLPVPVRTVFGCDPGCGCLGPIIVTASLSVDFALHCFALLCITLLCVAWRCFAVLCVSLSLLCFVCAPSLLNLCVNGDGCDPPRWPVTR